MKVSSTVLDINIKRPQPQVLVYALAHTLYTDDNDMIAPLCHITGHSIDEIKAKFMRDAERFFEVLKDNEKNQQQAG